MPDKCSKHGRQSAQSKFGLLEIKDSTFKARMAGCFCAIDDKGSIALRQVPSTRFGQSGQLIGFAEKDSRHILSLSFAFRNHLQALKDRWRI
jgi:hypothetical protein